MSILIFHIQNNLILSRKISIFFTFRKYLEILSKVKTAQNCWHFHEILQFFSYSKYMELYQKYKYKYGAKYVMRI